MVGAAATLAGVGMFAAVRGLAGSTFAETGAGFDGATSVTRRSCRAGAEAGAGIGGAMRGATSALNKSN